MRVLKTGISNYICTAAASFIALLGQAISFVLSLYSNVWLTTTLSTAFGHLCQIWTQTVVRRFLFGVLTLCDFRLFVISTSTNYKSHIVNCTSYKDQILSRWHDSWPYCLNHSVNWCWWLSESQCHWPMRSLLSRPQSRWCESPVEELFD